MKRLSAGGVKRNRKIKNIVDLPWFTTQFPKGRIARVRIDGRPAVIVENGYTDGYLVKTLDCGDRESCVQRALPFYKLKQILRQSCVTENKSLLGKYAELGSVKNLATDTGMDVQHVGRLLLRQARREGLIDA